MGTILGAVLLHEPITGLFIAGALLIFAGIGVAEGRLHYPIVKLAPAKGKPPIIKPVLPEPHPTPGTNKREILKQIFEKSS